VFWEIVVDEAATDFFHRNPLGLVRRRRRDIDVDARQRQAIQRSSTELLGALRGDIHEQESPLHGLDSEMCVGLRRGRSRLRINYFVHNS
jgi:hypothetical protein